MFQIATTAAFHILANSLFINSSITGDRQRR
jgi:hypothetical protein